MHFTSGTSKTTLISHVSEVAQGIRRRKTEVEAHARTKQAAETIMLLRLYKEYAEDSSIVVCFVESTI